MSCYRYLRILGTILLLILKVKAGEVCFEGLGCFSQRDPWVSLRRPFPHPENPQYINVSITFFSRNQTEGEAVEVYPDIVFKGEGFDPKKRTVTITHGFQSSASADWVHRMKDKYLKAMDANVFLVNWEKGASFKTYSQAAANARVVGAILGRFGIYLMQEKGVSHKDFHMIGHSLGAHISAYAAQKMNEKLKKDQKIFKITGLDPAQPGFQSLATRVRLSPDKAMFVEVIHSDAKPTLPLFGFGYLTSLGHVDFYLNKGFDQPGCGSGEPIRSLTSIYQIISISAAAINDAVSCSHGRSYQVYTSSIDPDVDCPFIGHRIQTKILISSNQMSCGINGEDCLRMGLDTSPSSQTGSFQVMTSGKEPYCCYNYSSVTGCRGEPGGARVNELIPSVSAAFLKSLIGW